MSERMEEMLAKLIQLQEETIKELKINNRFLAMLHHYGISERVARFIAEDSDLVTTFCSREI